MVILVENIFQPPISGSPIKLLIVIINPKGKPMMNSSISKKPTVLGF
jgi:hypothetical protein